MEKNGRKYLHIHVLRKDVSMILFYYILLIIEFLVAFMPTMKLITEYSQHEESLGKRHTRNLNSVNRTI